MTRLFLAALLGALLGGGLVWWGSGERAAEPAMAALPSSEGIPASETASELSRLREELHQERARAAELSAQVSALDFNPEAEPQAGAERETSWEQPAATEEGGEGSSAARPWFDARALEAAGWGPAEIDRIRERWEQYELAKLEIENQRARKVPGWKKLGGRFFQIATEARNDLGDEFYEAMLFASHQPNRVIVDEVLEISPAAEAGFFPGDELISYGGQRVFTPGAVQFLTTSGERGAWAEVWILRGGEELRLLVPRGPLGTRLKSVIRVPYR